MVSSLCLLWSTLINFAFSGLGDNTRGTWRVRSGFHGGWIGGGGSISLSGLAGSLETGSGDGGYHGDTESCACDSTSRIEEEEDIPPSYAEAVQGTDHDESVEGEEEAESHGWGPESLV